MPDAVRRPLAAATILVVAFVAVTAARPHASSGHDIPGFERFMDALGYVESGGRYDARNATSGAYGKYQIIPSSWDAWADEVLGDADAPMTPENQESVARYKVHQAWHRYWESWRVVAYWWLTGRAILEESQWTTYARGYVDKVMAAYAGSLGTKVYRYQEWYRYIGWSGSWETATHQTYAGDKVRWSGAAGARATFRFRGYSVAWIGPKGPTRGKAKVFVDGAYVRTVDLYASSFRAVNTIFSRRWSSYGYHTLVVEVVGTSGRANVSIDEFRVGK